MSEESTYSERHCTIHKSKKKKKRKHKDEKTESLGSSQSGNGKLLLDLLIQKTIISTNSVLVQLLAVVLSHQ